MGFWLGLGLGGTTRNRTGDTRIFSPLLYQLSYGTIVNMSCKKRVAELRVQRYDKYSYSPNLFPFFFLAPPKIDLYHLLSSLAKPSSPSSSCRCPVHVRKQANDYFVLFRYFCHLLVTGCQSGEYKRHRYYTAITPLLPGNLYAFTR